MIRALGFAPSLFAKRETLAGKMAFSTGVKSSPTLTTVAGLSRRSAILPGHSSSIMTHSLGSMACKRMFCSSTLTGKLASEASSTRSMIKATTMALPWRSHAMLMASRPSHFRIMATRTLASQSKETVIHTTTKEHDKKKEQNKKTGRYQVLVQKYGPLVVVFHTTVWSMVLLGLFLAFQLDLADVDFLLDYAPDSVVNDEKKEALLSAAHSMYGKFAIAYVLTLATGPVRLGFTIIATPWLSKCLTALNSPMINRYLLHNKYIEQMLKDPKSMLKMLGINIGKK